jgi:hypothetical protein
MTIRRARQRKRVSYSRRAAARAARAAGATVFAVLVSHAGSAFCAAQAAAPVSASSPVPDWLNADTLPPDFAGDDPEHVRDALSGHVRPGSSSVAPSIANRVRSFIEHPLRPFHGARQASSAHAASAANAASGVPAQAQTSRTFLFVVPAPYGVRVEARRKLLSVNVSLASPEDSGAILLRQTVKGQSGRKLAIAPEAKAKGFVQTFDTIQFRTGDSTRTTVKGRMLAPDLGDASSTDFAIVLVCTLEPPYMTERNEHSDPTDDEPTDITRKTSTLQGVVDAVWLIDRKDGAIISKRLRLVK